MWYENPDQSDYAMQSGVTNKFLRIIDDLNESRYKAVRDIMDGMSLDELCDLMWGKDRSDCVHSLVKDYFEDGYEERFADHRYLKDILVHQISATNHRLLVLKRDGAVVRDSDMSDKRTVVRMCADGSVITSG